MSFGLFWIQFLNIVSSLNWEPIIMLAICNRTDSSSSSISQFQLANFCYADCESRLFTVECTTIQTNIEISSYASQKQNTPNLCLSLSFLFSHTKIHYFITLFIPITFIQWCIIIYYSIHYILRILKLNIKTNEKNKNTTAIRLDKLSKISLIDLVSLKFSMSRTF